MHGPWWIGCWDSIRPEDICAALSKSPSLGSGFWLAHSIECEQLIEDRIKSHSIGILVVVGVLHVFWFYFIASLYCMCGGRARREIVYVGSEGMVKGS